MRLAYLVSQYPAASHTFILREIRALRRLGFDIETVSIRKPDRPAEAMTHEEREEASLCFTVMAASPLRVAVAHIRALLMHPLGFFGGLGRALRMAGWGPRRVLFHLFYFAEALVAGDHIARRGLPHIHTHFASTVALLAARVFGLSYSATIHGPDEFRDPAGFNLSEKAASAQFLCGISRYACEQIQKSCGQEHWNKLEVSPLGVDLSSFSPRPHRLDPECFEILCVARLAPVKAHDVLIRAAAAQVARGEKRLRLRLVGDGPERKRLERTITELGLDEYVQLLGVQNQDRVRQMYRETDLFALASLAEGVPVVLMEAMAMEIPCVATSVAGVPELIVHGENGWLVAPGDTEALAEALRRLMEDGDLRRRLGQAGRAMVMEEYNLEKNTARLAGIFQRRLRMLS
jgi:glycosyltransferase involved in cell wall biosynthesis